jgi:murein L,D-transpeptidase YafK
MNLTAYWGHEKNPGGDIFLHGNCVTIGCLPITDEGIKEVYWLAVLARTTGQMHAH